jgi:hypothetical protein
MTKGALDELLQKSDNQSIRAIQLKGSDIQKPFRKVARQRVPRVRGKTRSNNEEMLDHKPLILARGYGPNQLIRRLALA